MNEGEEFGCVNISLKEEKGADDDDDEEEGEHINLCIYR